MIGGRGRRETHCFQDKAITTMKINYCGRRQKGANLEH